MSSLTSRNTSFRQSVLAAVCIALCVGQAACGGGGHSLNAGPEGAAPMGSATRGVPAASTQTPEQQALARGLPSLDSLPEPVAKAPSLAGPGYIPLRLQDVLASHDAALSGGELAMPQTPGGLSWAVYGVGSFDGSARPTSVKLQHSASSQKVFVAFGDFTNQRWSIEGPYGPFASAGELEVEVPYGAEHSSPSSFTSAPGVGAKDGRFFFAVVLDDTDGTELRFTGLELGSHGGSLGPQAGYDVLTQNTSAGFLTIWNPSPDAEAPDFAGYLVERAPFFFGDFSPLNSEPHLDPYYLDEGTSIVEPFRYRVRAVDTAGNLSPWFAAFDVSGPILLTSPAVALLDMPRGPLFGAQDVHFDLSRSFAANSADTITSYKIELSGPVRYTGTEPQTTLRLQPGCYTVVGTIELDAISQVRTTRHLVVYPSWESESTLVSESPDYAFLPRLTLARAFRHPVDGQPYVCGFDNVFPAFSLWRIRPGGLDFVDSIPIYDTPESSSEPVSTNGAAWIGLETSSGTNIVRLGTDSVEQASFPFPLGGRPQMLVGASGNPQMLIEQESGGMSQLRLISFGDPFGLSVVLGPVDDISAFDAVFNPSSGFYDVLFHNSGGIQYLAFDLASDSVVHGPVPVLAGACSGIDVEYDPVAGRSVAQVLSTTEMRYLEWQDDGTPTVNQLIEPLISYLSFDLLLHDGQKYSAFASGTGQSHLYRQDGSGWTAVNSFDYSSDSAYQIGLVPPAAPGGALLVMDQLGLGGGTQIRVSRLDAGDVETEVASMRSQDSSGFCIQAVEGLSGLHLVWADLRSGALQHASSDNGGDTWMLRASPASFTPLTSPRHALGSVVHFGGSPPPDTPYLTYFDGSAYNIYAWDGASWNFATGKAGNGSSQPYFNIFPQSSLIMMGFSEDTVRSYRIFGNIDDGFSTTDLDLPDMRRPRAGTLNNAYLPGDLAEHSMILGESAGFLSIDMYHQSGGGSIESIGGLSSFGGSLLDPAELVRSEYVSGCAVASSAYVQQNGRPAQVFWCTTNDSHYPIRLDYVSGEADGDPLFSLEQFPVELNHNNLDVRRSISAAAANGGTAVGLLCSLDGKLQHLEWSNFGAWEQLALPPGLEHMASAELLVDDAGRWHIFYRDVPTGNVMTRRTLD